MMRILNFKAKKFIVGRSVSVIKTFVNGNTVLAVGEVGEIISEQTISLPDMNLFGIRVLEIEFLIHTVSVGEQIAEEYMKMI